MFAIYYAWVYCCFNKFLKLKKFGVFSLNYYLVNIKIIPFADLLYVPNVKELKCIKCATLYLVIIHCHLINVYFVHP